MKTCWKQEHKLPVNVRSSKTSLLKLPIFLCSRNFSSTRSWRYRFLLTQTNRATKDTREFKITTTATATGTSLNKRFNEQNSGYARASWLFVHFFAVLCQTTTWNEQFCVAWRTWTTTANFIKFYFKFIAVSQIQFRDSFDSDKQSKWLKRIPRFVGEI